MINYQNAGEKMHLVKFFIIKAFYNIKAKESDKPKTAFATKRGSCLGMSCPLARRIVKRWEQESDWAFRNLTQAIRHVDSVAIASTTNREHKSATKNLFERITKYILTLKMAKWEFF